MADTKLVELVTHIVGAYVEKNAVQPSQLPSLIASVSETLASLGKPIEPVAEKPVPAVNPKKSIFPDYLVCLDDGKKFKSLRRHLSTLGMTPEQYREKWDLPRDYPMVAPNYAAARSALAKASGLGRKAAPPPVEKPKAAKGAAKRKKAAA
jgi:predicted transcriptional regulator